MAVTAVTGKPSGLLGYPSHFPYAAYPGVVTAASSQVIARTHSGFVAPYAHYAYSPYAYSPYRYPYYF